MKLKKLLYSGLTIISYLQYGYACPGLSPHEQEVLTSLVKVTAVSERTPSSLWRGFSPFFTPLAIQFRTGKTILISHPNPPAGYSPLKTACPALLKNNQDKDIYIGTRDIFPQTLTHTTINNDKVFAILDEGQSTPAEFAAFAVHEIFHLFQNKNFRSPRATVSDAITPESLAGEYQERLALSRALYSTDSAWETQFVSLRKARYKKQDKGLTSLQESEELSEGTASYVGLKALAILREDKAEPSRLFTDLVAAKLFPKMLPYSKRPFYGSGAALCLLLDRHGSDWQRSIESGAYLFQLLNSTAVLENKEQRHIAPFSGLAKDQIIWSEGKKKELLNELYDIKKSRLIVEFRSRTEVSGTGKGSNNVSYRIGTDQTLVYPDYLAFSKEPQFSLVVQNSLFMLSHSADPDKQNYRLYRYETTVFRPDTMRVTIDGKSTAIDAAAVNFSKITFNSGNISLTLNAKGKYVKRGNVFIITAGEID